MEDAEEKVATAQAMEGDPVTRVQRLSRATFNAVKDKGVPECELEVYEEDLQGEQVDDKVKNLIKHAVYFAYYRNRQLSKADLDAAASAAIAELRKIQSETADNENNSKIRKLVPDAFDSPYKGDADISFQKYLARCCQAYLEDVTEKKYTAPYVTITQSSGFGKSRILKRLAEQHESIEHDGAQFDVKVLYICARTIEGSSGYPCATPELRKWLFPAENCTEKNIAIGLEKAFKYSIENSDAQGNWKKLFEVDDNRTADREIMLELDNVQLCLGEPKQKRPKSKARRTPVLVVAIDEARALLNIEDSNGDNTFHLMRRALNTVNKSATVRNANGIAFGIVADTNSRVHEFVPALSEDPSSRPSATKNTALFPPFILTETMDIMMDDGTSKGRVLNTSWGPIWETLVSMGRPLWHSVDDKGMNLPARKEVMINFAASKLLIGLDPKNPASYKDSTLHGVSSLFCRVGLRPNASNPIASRLVADFMSVLHYVSYKNDAQISGYVSDPILTFGASSMWYQLKKENTPSALESHILPQFLTMLLNGVVDTGNIGELVARIFLLLAMDAVAAGSSDKRDFVFSGAFCDLAKFVEMLVGDNPPLRADKAKADDQPTMDLCVNWLKSWDGWQICFSHFVELREEPTKDTLWMLLDRRAAGIFRRGQPGADLIIPIFHPKQKAKENEQVTFPDGSISFVLVQVKNLVEKDGKFPGSALGALSSLNVFTTTDDPDSLYATKSEESIRLYMSLREVPNETETPAQSIVVPSIRGTRIHDNIPKDFDGSLCVRGMFVPSTDQESDDSTQRWPFLSKELVEMLREIANAAWWDGRDKVEYDLKSRSEYEKKTDQTRLSSVLPDDVALETALNTLKFASKVKAQEQSSGGL